MPYSPTELTLRKWRKAGYRAAVVEKWNGHTKTRHDLFGFIDVLAVGHGKTIGIQSTSRGNVSSRMRKIEALEAESRAVTPLLAAGWEIYIEGWSKQGHRWGDRVEQITLDSFPAIEPAA